MERNLRGFAAAGSLFLAMFTAEAAFAQKQGGILKMYSPDSPASMSIHEEATVFAEGPMMGVFNNLVMYDQHVPQSSLQSIVPDLAIGWSWNEDGTELTLPLREGVTWHDGKPFTAKDVQCTFEMLTGKSSDKLRVNPRKAWYGNLDNLQPSMERCYAFGQALARIVAAMGLNTVVLASGGMSHNPG
jgi:peptide/nickel transport system substrate-binding protein